MQQLLHRHDCLMLTLWKVVLHTLHSTKPAVRPANKSSEQQSRPCHARHHCNQNSILNPLTTFCWDPWNYIGPVPTFYAAVRHELRNLNTDLWPISTENWHTCYYYPVERLGFFLRLFFFSSLEQSRGLVTRRPYWFRLSHVIAACKRGSRLSLRLMELWLRRMSIYNQE